MISSKINKPSHVRRITRPKPQCPRSSLYVAEVSPPSESSWRQWVLRAMVSSTAPWVARREIGKPFLHNVLVVISYAGHT